MQDEQIVQLYWQRDEAAIRQTEQKYGNYLMKIAYHILADREDSRESVSDTYLRAWQSMPPHKPQMLATYLGKIPRETAIDRFRRRNRQKRRASEYACSLEELCDCVSGIDSTEAQIDLRLLCEAIEDYLSTLSQEMRVCFVARYYFCDPLKTIASRHGMSESKLKSMLYRVRQGLKEHLQVEGFVL